MTRRAAPILLAPVVIALGLVQAIVSQVPEKKFVTKDGKRPTGLFAPGVFVGKTLYIAGKGDYRREAPFPEKVKNCLTEVRKMLQAAGLDMQHVVKSFVYLEDHDKFGEFNKQYAEFFKNDPPARTTLGVAEVPGESRVEITCIAYSDLSEKKRVGDPPPNRRLGRAGCQVYGGDTAVPPRFRLGRQRQGLLSQLPEVGRVTPLDVFLYAAPLQLLRGVLPHRLQQVKA